MIPVIKVAIRLWSDPSHFSRVQLVHWDFTLTGHLAPSCWLDGLAVDRSAVANVNEALEVEAGRQNEIARKGQCLGPC